MSQNSVKRSSMMIEKFASPFADTYWHCSHCDHLNAADGKACSQCGTSRISDQMKSLIINPLVKEAKDTQVAGTHYKDMDIEPWDVIDTWPIEQQVGYHRGNLLKYTMRMGRKDNDIQEIEKARHYAQKLKEVLDSEKM